MAIPNEVTIPEHYKLFVKEIEPYVEQIRAAVKYKLPCGTPLETVSQTKTLIDSQAMQNISDSITSFGSNIFARESVSSETITLEADRFGSAVRYYLSLFEIIRSRPFPPGYESGHPLLVAVLRKPLQDLLDAMDQVLVVMTNPEEGVARHGGLIISLVIKFDIESEAQRFQRWIDSVVVEEYEAGDNYTHCSQPKKSTDWFWGILGGIALYDIFFDKD